MVPMIMLALPAFSRAEHPADDFSWLDDMIINQLKALMPEFTKGFQQKRRY